MQAVRVAALPVCAWQRDTASAGGVRVLVNAVAARLLIVGAPLWTGHSVSPILALERGKPEINLGLRRLDTHILSIRLIH